MRHAPLFLAVALSAVTAFGARTEAASPVVVELFTSQGCSSCPPADEILGDLAMRPDVLALSLNVDYWDYLGWKDTFALPGNAVRQRQYVAGWGGRTVYTPQMVIGGAVDVVGNKRRAVESALQKLAATPAAAEIRLSRTADGAVTAQISATGATAKPAVVWL